MRKSGRVSAAALATPVIDVRAEREPPPERLTPVEQELWNRLIQSRRPGWFAGGLEVLENYVVAMCACQQVEAELRRTPPSASARYSRCLRMHRQQVTLCAMLATKLRLVPSTRRDKNTPPDGDKPMMDPVFPWNDRRPLHAIPDAVAVDGERCFADLRQALSGNVPESPASVANAEKSSNPKDLKERDYADGGDIDSAEGNDHGPR